MAFQLRATEIVGTSEPIRRLLREVQLVAPTDSTVLIAGETGTGKGLVARYVHQQSRTKKTFVHVDCSALPEGVIESELFGHERGAFTSATTRRLGRFEMAEGGTIFLDEIAEIDLRTQAKFLRVLQDREYERVGGSSTLRMTARVIAASSRDLAKAVEAGTFRRDLYFRLQVVRLWLPPLRERLEDLPQLVEHAVTESCAALGLDRPVVEAPFVHRLQLYEWPGNVRELFNLLERILVLCRVDRLGWAHAARFLDNAQPSAAATEGPVGVAAPEPSEMLPEARRIATVLAETGGNVARASRRLNLPRSTLRYRIHTYRLEHMIPAD